MVFKIMLFSDICDSRDLSPEPNATMTV